MNFKLINRVTGAIVFVFTLVIYYITMQPTFAFWDPGEYTSVSYILGIPHPPGVPFNVLLGRIFSMIPTASDMSARIALNSVIASVFAILFLYLISVKVITYWRGKPKDNFDSIIICTVSAISALALAFCGSYWFNALETEAESKAIFFITLITLLSLIWRERVNETGIDKYILLGCFLTGLGVGSHLLVAQSIIVIVLFYYFGRFEYKPKTLVIAFVVAGLAFLTVFPLIIIKLPKLVGSNSIIAVLLFALVLFGIYYSGKNKLKFLNFVLLAIIFVVIGYSIFISITLRASVDNLSVNQNNPRTTDAFVSYLSREQYGEQPVFWPRRYSMEPQHQPTWNPAKYSSDFDFMLKYQINEMFNRYVMFQFIGREGYNQGDGIDIKKLYGIPFLLGMVGLFYLFRKDKKTGFLFLFMFLMFGVFTALYQNQQDPQPRERDYFYVGAYMVFALWIGHGVLFLADTIKEKISQNTFKPVVSGILVLSFLFVPLNMLKNSYHYQDRSGNYMPFDFAYNILQSCEKDAILITNGDNDTFPLWCVQAVYGIRTDIRIINLSLANIDWYTLQLKNEKPYGALTVPFTYSNEQLKKLQPTLWDENKPYSISVPPEAYPDTMKVKPDRITIKIPATIRQKQGNQNITAITAADLITLDVIKANNWKRPIYFSITVADMYCLGLTEYLKLEGLVQKLVPYNASGGFTQNVNEDITSKCLFKTAGAPVTTPNYGFLFRNLNDGKVFYDETHRRMMESYRQAFIRLAYSYSEDSTKYKLVKQTLDELEATMPRAYIVMDYRIKYNIATLYKNIKDEPKFMEYANEVEKAALDEIQKYPNNVSYTTFNPYVMLVDIYDHKGDYQKAYSYLKILSDRNPNDPNILMKIEGYKKKLGIL